MDEFYISSIAPKIQNVGRHSGTPMLEIRFDEVNENARSTNIRDIIKQIDDWGMGDILLSGEEPLRQWDAIEELCTYYSHKINTKQLRPHLMSTANTIDSGDFLQKVTRRFHYIMFFPTTIEKAKFLHTFLVDRWFQFGNKNDIVALVSPYDKDQRALIEYATMVVPQMKMVAEDPVELQELRKYCIEKKVIMSVMI